MSGLKKREKWFITVSLLFCVAIVAVVVMLFLQLDEGENIVTGTPSPERTPVGTPTMTPIPSDVIVVPGTNAPVFFGVSSSISVDCIDPRFVKQQVVDRLFYLGYVEDVDYTVEETDVCTVVQVKLNTDKDAFAALYTEMLNLIYGQIENVNQHLENGVSVDKNGIQSDDQYSYLTMRFYLAE